jgi:SAM-dependent methyltransferase
MELTSAYLAEQHDVVSRAWCARKLYSTSARFARIREFIDDCATVLSVGCGPYEPVVINATHACDIADNALTFLKLAGWLGEFRIGSCDKLPYLYKQFDAAVCSEVIEHLPDLETVKRTFQELTRVAKKWIVTTPCNPLGPKNTEPTHKHAFTEEELIALALPQKIKVEKDDTYFYATCICPESAPEAPSVQ